MPIYEYHCEACGKNLEILQKISAPLKRKCPECGGRLKKLVSESAFQLKGTGWYKTDYASKPDRKEETAQVKEKEEEKKKEASKKEEKKSEAPKEPEKKPAAPKSASHKS